MKLSKNKEETEEEDFKHVMEVESGSMDGGSRVRVEAGSKEDCVEMFDHILGEARGDEF